MNIEQFRGFCLEKPFVTEEFPFSPENLVFKVAGKIFAITDLEGAGFKVNLKCNPDYSIELRELYPEVSPVIT